MATDRKNPTRGSASESRYSLMEFMREFPDDDACLDYLWRSRYAPDGEHAECSRCRTVRTFKRYETKQRRQSWTCTACGHHLHPTAGTIFHRSSTSLHLWFYALYLITSTRCGISAKQLERELGVTYKTAWRMFNRIRNSLMTSDGVVLGADAPVEMDEMYLTPMRRLSDPPGQSGRSLRERVVIGAVERHGKVVAKHVSAATLTEASRLARVHILPSSAAIRPASATAARGAKATLDPLARTGRIQRRPETRPPITAAAISTASAHRAPWTCGRQSFL